MTEKQELRAFIKDRYPVGTVIQDWTCSEPYTIKKSSVFEIHPWLKEDYNSESLPINDGDYDVDFLVHDAGKNSRVHELCWLPKNQCLKKYMSEKHLKMLEKLKLCQKLN